MMMTRGMDVGYEGKRVRDSKEKTNKIDKLDYINILFCFY